MASSDVAGESTGKKKKILIEVDEDDPCLKKDEEAPVPKFQIFVPGEDPRIMLNVV
ncbi:uncharacterized protein LOC100877758 isoform X2 [Megachile rotundata]|uniref:uncharacterized protein LOC100877758 isoform X2 n=1 Tax=Megachile rotundata TaxID=143995 RepID=UPI003FCF344F